MRKGMRKVAMEEGIRLGRWSDDGRGFRVSTGWGIIIGG